MRNKLILLLIITLIIPLIVAQTYPQSQELDLKIPFEVNGSDASATATCNISIDYPDGTSLKENVSMNNKNNGDFNYTLNATETSIIGEYNWRMFCCDGASCATGYGNYEITPSGSDAINSGEGLTLALSIFFVLVIASLFFIASFKVISFPSKLIFMGLALIFFVIASIFIMITFSQVLGGYSTLISSYSSFFWLGLFLFFLVFLFLLLCLFRKVVELFKIKRGLYAE